MKADHKKDELSADERSSEDEVYFNEYLSADYIDLHLMGRGDAYKVRNPFYLDSKSGFDWILNPV